MGSERVHKTPAGYAVWTLACWAQWIGPKHKSTSPAPSPLLILSSNYELRLTKQKLYLVTNEHDCMGSMRNPMNAYACFNPKRQACFVKWRKLFHEKHQESDLEIVPMRRKLTKISTRTIFSDCHSWIFVNIDYYLQMKKILGSQELNQWRKKQPDY